MPAYIDRDGFPFWGNPSPQKPGVIPGRQIMFMVQDTAVNQVFSGRADEINIKQIPRPKQAQAEGYGSNELLETGKYGSTLYDQFMAPFTRVPVPKVKTP